MADPYEPDFDDGIKEEKVPKMGSAKKSLGGANVKMTPNKVATPSTPGISAMSTPVGVTAAKITPARRESNRQIKKPKREFMDSDIDTVSF